jgi:hypothetical protein
MTLLSLLTRPISVSCLLLFGVAPLLNPMLWAASRSGVKPLGKEAKEALPLTLFSEEKEYWELFKEISSHFQKENTQETLKKASVFLLRWPHAPMSDSVRLMAASCASRLELFEQALALCDNLQDADLKNQILAQRLKWLYALHRYQEAYEIGLKAPLETLGAERKAWSRFYIAEALYQEACDNYQKHQRYFDNDLSHMEQAYALYTSAQEIIGYMAVYGRASSAETIGLIQVAASSYLKAAKMPGADTGKCLYLAARLLADDEPTQAYQLCQELLAESGQWQAPAAFLWMQMALKTGQAQEVLKYPQWVKIARQQDALGAQYFLGSALALQEQKSQAISTLWEVVNQSLNSSQDIEAYGKPALVRLASLYTAEDNPKALMELNELVGQKAGRSSDYFFVCFKLAQLFDQLHQQDLALDQYARITVQAADSPWISTSLLRKGEIEADKGLFAPSWASLDLYLRKHASASKQEAPWPLFLKVTSELSDYKEAASFNASRFKLVLDRLKSFEGSEEQKIQYLVDEAERLYQQLPAKAELFLLAIQTHASNYFIPSQELLLAMCRAKAEHNVDAFMAAVKPAIARAGKEKTKLEIRLAKCLLELAENEPSIKKKAQEMAAGALIAAFESSPAEISREESMWLAGWVQGLLAQKSFEGDWGKYFIDPIFDRSTMRYMALDLDSTQKLWAKHAVAVLQNVLNRGQADLSTRLMLARLQWASQHFSACSQTLITLQSSILGSENQEAVRAYLTYDCGAHILAGETIEALAVSQQLLELMGQEKDPSLAASLRLCLARACTKEAQNRDPMTAASLNKQALALYEVLCAHPSCDIEPLFLEANIERALLQGHLSPAKSASPSTFALLLAVKRHYMEADTTHAQTWQSRMQSEPQVQKLGQSYMLLLDALIAQYEAKELLATAQSAEERQDATVHLSLAHNLYQTLQTDRYGMTPFLKEMSIQGMSQLESLQFK